MPTLAPGIFDARMSVPRARLMASARRIAASSVTPILLAVLAPARDGKPISQGLPFPRCQRQARLRGFTLVEILVVLVVLAIAAGAAVVAYDGDERGLVTREARRFAGVLEHAAQSAQVRAETFGVSASGSGWRFWRRHPESGQWQPLEDDDVLAPHALPASMRVAAAAYGGQPIDGNVIVPLRPTGRNEPYTFGLHAGRLHAWLVSDPLNRVTVSAVEDAAAP
jgi:general secretion pathway protein H